MERSVNDADQVLVICTDTYNSKADHGLGGVGYEKGIVSAEILGTTAGRGHRAPTLEQTRPVKQMLGLPLNTRFREVLSR